MPQLFAEDPVDAVRRNLYISPFWEDDLVALAQHLPMDHLMFGSDFPHPEGLADPLSYVEHLDRLSDDETAKVMGGTLTSLID
jgi:predicted TIM-barrel fold metal-dependent hydrolase